MHECLDIRNAVDYMLSNMIRLQFFLQRGQVEMYVARPFPRVSH